MSNSMGSIKIRSLATIIGRYRVQSRRYSSLDHHRNSAFSSNNGLMFSSLIGSDTANSTKTTAVHIKMNDDKTIGGSPLPGPVKPSLPSWAKWLFGSFLSVVLPFWTHKWAKLLILGGTVEKVVDEVEIVAEVVEKVATTAEKVSEEVADKLPDNARLKEAALFVEHVAIEAAKDAQLTEDVIRKVDELEHDLTDLGTMVKPIINMITKKKVECHMH